MKLIHVIPHIDQEAAGPSYSVPRLCEHLAALGNEVQLSCLAARGEIPGATMDLHPQWPVLGRFAVSSSLVFAMRRGAEHADIVHNHSLWSMVNVAAGWVVPGRAAKLVTSPRGTLSPWALGRTRRLKRILAPFQWRALSRADLLHATSEVELQEIRAQGFDAPVAVIPNGIDIPVLAPRAPQRSIRTLLFLSRIHPTKALDRLLKAWQLLQDTHDDWRLVIAGRGESAYVREVQSMAGKLGLRRTDFLGALYGSDKSQAYRDADLFVLPTHSENFGMVVAEALAQECPVVVSRGAPWSQVVDKRCGWWVDNRVDCLADALSDAMSQSPATLASMGFRGRQWMQQDFAWPSVAARMEAAYLGILDGGDRPDWLRAG